MNRQQFIAKQTVKYYWKALKQTTRISAPIVRDPGTTQATTLWDYEKTPRVV